MNLLLTLSGKTFFVASLTDWCENNIRKKEFAESVNFSIYPEYRKFNRRSPFGILILNGIDMDSFEKNILNRQGITIHGPRTIGHRSMGVDGWYHNNFNYISEKYVNYSDKFMANRPAEDDLLVFRKMAQHTNINETSCYGNYPLCGQSFVFANEKIDFNVNDYELVYVEHWIDEDSIAKFFKIKRNDNFVGIILFMGGKEVNDGCMFGDQLNYVESLPSGSICLTNTFSRQALDQLLEMY